MTTSFAVDRVATRIVDHPLRPERIIVSHAGKHDASHYLVVTVHGRGGVDGYGEAATTRLWSGETAETAQRMIEQVLAPRVVGATFDHPREAMAVMDATLFGNPFAKSAVDTALWDLWAKQQGRAVADLIADRTPAESVPTRASIGTYGVEQTVRIALELWDAGIRTLKFKVGVPGLDDAARLRAVRDALGDAPVFTVDANCAYRTADAAVAAVEAMLPFNLALVEQPTPRERLAMLAEVRRRVPLPVMADESVFTPGDLGEALDLDAFDILSIYPGKNGGFTHSLEMVRTAHRAGKRCSIGCNLETDLGQAAMGALAAGLSAFPLEEIAADMPAAIFYQRSSVREPLPLRDGRVTLPRGAGFGVEPAGA